MSIFDIFRRREKVSARYEAGVAWTPDRSWLPAYVQGADQDIEHDRWEMVRKARYFEKNSALVQKILDLIETNVVGNGINPTPMSADEKWCEKALEQWDIWRRFADVGSRQDFYSVQALLARAQAVDGEVFVELMVYEGRPRIRLFEAHQIEQVAIGPFGRVVGYQILDGKERRMVPSGAMVHVFDPSRIGQHRGITVFHAALHTLHDLDDLQRFEMLAAKDAASRANIVYTENGELPKTQGIGTSVLGTSTPADDRQAFYEKAFPGKTIALRRGDKWEQAQALRPSPAMREFWEYLTELSCKAVGISYAAIQDYRGSWGGAALRAAVVSDNRFYDIRTRSMTTALDRIWEHFVINTPELSPFPADFRKVRWQPPKRATVDVGRESKAILEELRAGVRNYRDVLGEMGLDWRDTLRQRIAEQKFIADTAEDIGVPSGLVLSLLGAANNTNIFAEKAGEAIDGPSDQPTTKSAEVDQ